MVVGVAMWFGLVWCACCGGVVAAVHRGAACVVVWWQAVGRPAGGRVVGWIGHARVRTQRVRAQLATTHITHIGRGASGRLSHMLYHWVGSIIRKGPVYTHPP